ncbi:nucleotidyltransferase family protein [Thermodesulfobacteriota bacterium]
MAVSSKDELLDYLIKNKLLLQKKFGVNRIGIFGSFSKEKQNHTSDIDMVVDFKKSKKNIHSFLQLKRYLEAEFDRKVDIGIEQTLKPIIKEDVKEDIIYV